MASYQSDYEKFLNEMRGKYPEWEDGQREGMSLLWNKRVNLAEQKTFREAADKQGPYPYDVNF